MCRLPQQNFTTQEMNQRWASDMMFACVVFMRRLTLFLGTGSHLL
jgi:hypothetical protein